MTSVNDAATVTATVAVDGEDMTAEPVGGVPEATAVFTIAPASTSAWVVMYVPVQVVEACGASVVTGQLITGGVPVPENARSTAPTPVNVSFPVLTTR
ncbi:hypothetical protein SAMN05216276_1003306 [Streptosporangium subroseum]|uniref:Uncharacterized protein n=1 Tax=Streptosporangium subroseum TaxID=106412 RepID=A0A239BNH2_9ACTN|nr:hypothetical protein SAMN05216276_1003306 [Streptosporangium subroseum]